MAKKQSKRQAGNKRIEKLAIEGESEDVKYKYSQAKTLEICRYLREDLNIQDSCALAGIAKDTYHRWKQEHADFSDATKVAELACKRENIRIILRSAMRN